VKNSVSALPTGHSQENFAVLACDQIRQSGPEGIMKRFLLGSAALLNFVGGYPAMAADITVKAAPAAAVATEFNWTGFYVGLNAGDGFGNASSSMTGLPTPATFAGLAPAVPASYSPPTDGFVGGGQIGYNYQINQMIVGFETDLSYAHIHGAVATIGLESTGPFSYSQSQELDLFGTVRGRIGFTPFSNGFLYATGGLAYGEVKAANTLAFPNGPFFGEIYFGSISTIKTGWTVGGGWEEALVRNWTAKLEYLYYDLGTVTIIGIPTPPILGQVQTSTAVKINGNIIRLGLNYKFN